MLFGLSLSAQIRTSLYEEFTGENFGLWYPTNPNLNALLASNASLVIPIKWQVPFPTAPTNINSLYQTNKAEINWRCKSSSGGTLAAGPSTLAYGYPSQNTPSDVAVNGINSGSTGRIDGQHQWVFGAASDDPADVSNAVITSAQTQTTNFRILMDPSWSPTFTNCVVSVTIISSTSFTSVGALMFRLCLVERNIQFATPPGINGEKKFYDAVRKSYPTTVSGTSVTAMGTVLNSTWTPSQTQIFTVNCPIPAYIRDPSQMAFVGFIQDDGNRIVYQAARTAQPAIPNDIKAVSVDIPLSCTSNFTPSFVAENLGQVTVTSLTIAPYIDGIAQSTYIYSGTIPGGTSATLALPGYTASFGKHTFSINVTGVSGGDMNVVNNTTKSMFGISNTLTTTIAETFSTFPPPNWYFLNYDFENATWGIGNAGGFGNSPTSAKYDFWNGLGGLGGADDLFLPAIDLTGVTNVGIAFDVAYAQYTNQNDELKVMASTDCGINWTTVYSKQGASLASAPSYSVGPFLPGATQWRRDSVALPAFANQAHVLVKFVANSDFGNNLYIDNVNLGPPPPTNTTTALSEEIKNSNFEIGMFPNPTSDFTNLSVNLNKSEIVGIRINNSLGQLFYDTKNNPLETGQTNILLNTENWPCGLYSVSVSTDKGIINAKLSIVR